MGGLSRSPLLLQHAGCGRHPRALGGFSYSSPGGEGRNEVSSVPRSFKLPGESTGFVTFSPNPTWSEMATDATTLHVFEPSPANLLPLAVWEVCLAGEEEGICPYSDPAVSVLRILGPAPNLEFEVLKFKILGLCISKPGLGKLP